MAWERVTCPGCGRSMAVTPSDGRMMDHAKTKGGEWCPGSYSTFEEARIGALDWDELEQAVRGALQPDGRARIAFDDLMAKAHSEIEEGRQAMESNW